MKTVLRLFVLFLFLTVAEAEPSESENPFVSFSRGRLTIRAVEVSLNDLLQEIREKCDIVIDLRGEQAAEKRLTLELINLPPEFALEQVLRGFSFAFFYDQSGLAQVVALSLSPEGSPPEPSLSSSSPKPPPPDAKPLRPNSAPDFEQLLERNREEGLKSLREALANRDPKVKRSALEVLAETEGPDVISILSAALRDPDPSFRIEVLEALADKGELQLVSGALEDQNREVRERATELLESDGEAENKAP